MLLRRTLAVALLCALPVAAFAAEAPATVKWPMPWKLGTTLKYATEDTTTDATKPQPRRTRSTSTDLVRITEAKADGFLQTWTGSLGTYEVLEGDKAEEAQMQAFGKSLADLPVEIVLNGEGNYTQIRNIGAIAPRVRAAMGPLYEGMLETDLEKIPDETLRDAARKEGKSRMDAALAMMTEPKLLESMLARNISGYNAFVGIDVEPDATYEADIELPNPLGGDPLPGKLRFMVSLSEDDPEDLYVDYEQALDMEKARQLVGVLMEKMTGHKITEAELASLTLDVKDTGLFVVNRQTGVVEMFEATRTTTVEGKQKVERHRMRQLEGAHDHVWRDETSEDDKDA